MKKHLSLLFILTISACSGPAISSVSKISSNQDSVVVSSTESIYSSEKVSSSTADSKHSSSKEVSSSSLSSSSNEKSSSIASSSSITSSSHSSSSSSAKSSSSSVISSSSSSSSSKEEEQPLSSLEAFNLLHEGLKLKNSTFIDETYIEQKLVNEKILTNHYLGKFASQKDDGYISYLNQGLYHYEKDESGVRVGDCKSLNATTTVTEFFYTTYDLLSYKSKWKATNEDYVFTSTNVDLSGLIAELDGQGIYASVASSCNSKLVITEDGLSARYTTEIKTDGYGDYTMSFLLKDLGTTKDETIQSFLNNASSLEISNDFPNETKILMKEILGFDLPAPIGASYAHSVSYYYLNNQIAQITYEDYLVGNQIDNYRASLLASGFTLSELTDEIGDLKKYGYVRYYYEINIDNNIIYVEAFYLPKVNLEAYEQGLYPNGIFHIRLIKQ